MSFSGDVKEELEKAVGSGRHCQIAELAMLLTFCAEITEENGEKSIVIKDPDTYAGRKCFTLLKKAYNIDSGFFGENLQEVIKSCKLGESDTISPLLIKNSCCKRAALRGAFLSAGSISDPEKGYHLEFVCGSLDAAERILELLQSFELEGRIVLRKKYHVVYLKEGSAIVDFLNIIEAHVSLMNLENLRILKDIGNNVNRRVNCEVANSMKTIGAAGRQIADISLIQQTRGLDSLPEPLFEAAEIRLKYPEEPLLTLAGLMDPPIGKSGMNHRLRKISEIAEEIRNEGLVPRDREEKLL